MRTVKTLLIAAALTIGAFSTSILIEEAQAVPPVSWDVTCEYDSGNVLQKRICKTPGSEPTCPNCP